MTVVLLLLAFAAILAGALLFTNAVEWLGHRLDLGQGAVGALLAAVSTALPEIIPVIAILRGDAESESVAVGAIIGAPFRLATLAMALVGIAAIVFAKRRDEGRALTAHRPTLRRDLLFFLTMLTLALGAGALGLVPPLVLAPLFVLAYVGYVALTLRRGGETESEDELPDLVADPDSSTPPANWRIGAQFLVSLALIVGGAHVFVEELLVIAERLDASPLVLSLLLAPLATELPEKANSVLWIRDGKDSLALGNITGAMVFQSTIPVSVGLAFTDWELDRYALLAGALALTGALIALWSLSVRRRFTLPAVAAWTLLFLGLVAALVLT